LFDGKTLRFQFLQQYFANKSNQKAVIINFHSLPTLASVDDITRPHFSLCQVLTTRFSSLANDFSLSLPVFSIWQSVSLPLFTLYVIIIWIIIFLRILINFFVYSIINLFVYTQYLWIAVIQPSTLAFLRKATMHAYQGFKTLFLLWLWKQSMHKCLVA